MRWLFVIAVALLLAPAASARNYKADILLNPAPEVGAESAVTGCGYEPLKEIQLTVIWYSDEVGTLVESWVTYPVANASGCMSTSWTFATPGYYQLWTMQSNRSGNGVQVKSRIDLEVE